jgi:hypothetical protein
MGGTFSLSEGTNSAEHASVQTSAAGSGAKQLPKVRRAEQAPVPRLSPSLDPPVQVPRLWVELEVTKGSVRPPAGRPTHATACPTKEVLADAARCSQTERQIMKHRVTVETCQGVIRALATSEKGPAFKKQMQVYNIATSTLEVCMSCDFLW